MHQASRWEDTVPGGPPISKLDGPGIALLQRRLDNAANQGTPTHMQFKYPGKKPPAEAAVYLLLCSVNGKPSVLFEERHNKLSSHSGEACFAGGKADDMDGSLVGTAIREAVEELGIVSGDIQTIGYLPPVPSKDHRLRVHPFVGVLRSTVDPRALSINREEVHRAFALPLDHFYDPRKRSLMRFRNSTISIPAYESDKSGLTIWGLTAFILHEFLRRVSDPRNDGNGSSAPKL
ncbi:hypothetical protein IW140_004985 [Coemansia sp. RSA 1813]|nr:hypothetical protein LPJ74_004797 [Coemansia sp. RSA 1843]KAJ2566297.1 hypothetical protein IW140_004985 [Coemansia sp. RSA 1813]